LTKCGTRPSGLSAKFGVFGALQMLRTPAATHSSIINLEALPAGTLP
jgi:hypothetical protein